MDNHNDVPNNNNFEQQFVQNLQPTPAPVPTPMLESSKSKLHLIIIIIILSIALLIESIILIITLSTFFGDSSSEYDNDEAYITSDQELTNVDPDFVYDGEDNLIAINDTCKNNDGLYFAFTTDNQYQQKDASGAIIDSGTYTVFRDNIISLSGSNDRTLYYDIVSLADGTNIYDCGILTTEEQ